MLKIKYFEEFKNNEPYLVIISDRDGFLRASEYFSKANGAFLCHDSITELCDLNPLKIDDLYLSANECHDIATIFTNIASNNIPKHHYFDIKSLPEIEILISYLEYDRLF